jgi:hypothetical protein
MYLVFLEATTCVPADDLSPEGLGRTVLRHLTNLPATDQGGEHRLRKQPADALVPVLLEDEELIHPVPVRSDANRRIDQSDACVLTIDGGNKGIEAF